tara:strand:- start:84 stop:740 length:657 start_codon:yes stop_codon:yes gene_type:complete
MEEYIMSTTETLTELSTKQKNSIEAIAKNYVSLEQEAKKGFYQILVLFGFEDRDDEHNFEFEKQQFLLLRETFKARIMDAWRPILMEELSRNEDAVLEAQYKKAKLAWDAFTAFLRDYQEVNISYIGKREANTQKKTDADRQKEKIMDEFSDLMAIFRELRNEIVLQMLAKLRKDRRSIDPKLTKLLGSLKKLASDYINYKEAEQARIRFEKEAQNGG